MGHLTRRSDGPQEYRGSAGLPGCVSSGQLVLLGEHCILRAVCRLKGDAYAFTERCYNWRHYLGGCDAAAGAAAWCVAPTASGGWPVTGISGTAASRLVAFASDTAARCCCAAHLPAAAPHAATGTVAESAPAAASRTVALAADAAPFSLAHSARSAATWRRGEPTDLLSPGAEHSRVPHSTHRVAEPTFTGEPSAGGQHEAARLWECRTGREIRLVLFTQPGLDFRAASG